MCSEYILAPYQMGCRPAARPSATYRSAGVRACPTPLSTCCYSSDIKLSKILLWYHLSTIIGNSQLLMKNICSISYNEHPYQPDLSKDVSTNLLII